MAYSSQSLFMQKELNQHIIDTVVANKIYVLRDKRGIALNASFSPDGLRFTTNKKGQNLFFKEGNYVERFIPQNKKNAFAQMAEITWLDKAYRLCVYNQVSVKIEA